MIIDEIREACALGVPFNLTLADGNQLHIPHGDYVMIAPDEDTLVTYPKGSKHHVLVATAHIVSLDVQLETSS